MCPTIVSASFVLEELLLALLSLPVRAAQNTIAVNLLCKIRSEMTVYTRNILDLGNFF